MPFSKSSIYFILLGSLLALAACNSNKKAIKALNYYQAGESFMVSKKYKNTLSTELAGNAETNFRKALEYDKKFYLAAKGQARSLYYLKKYEQSIRILDSLQKIRPSDSQLDNLIAMAYGALGNYQMAEKYYLAGLEFYKNDPDIHYNMGVNYSDWGRHEDAVNSYNKTLETDSMYHFAISNKALTLVRLKRYEEALILYNKTLSMDSTDRSSMNGRGLVHLGMKNYKLAIYDFNRVLDLPKKSFNTKRDTYIKNNLANAYFAIGEVEKACINWKAAIESGYVFEERWRKEFNIEDPLVLIARNCN